MNPSRQPVPIDRNRRIRVFISSTFRDMMAERDALMSHTWPELRRFCRERQVELVEVDMRWGITEEQSTRKETLKLCLDEIRACRPYFVGLLGERYGWMPSDEAFTADLTEEQPWISQLHGKSVTELEILHGVLNTPEMAGRSFFYFRDPVYSRGCGPDFQAEDAAAADKQADLKERIRQAHRAAQVELYENYPDPAALAMLVLDHLRAAIETEFPQDDVPDALVREARSHESFAEIRRRTYIGRADHFRTLDHHIDNQSGPLVLLGDSGSGKSALLANWVVHWRKKHPKDFIFQHYIGGTPDSADHWQLIKRLMAEIKKWSDDPTELPTSHDDIARDFRLWLAKARLKAQHDCVRCILIIDALNQLDDHDNSRLLGWLPPDVFTGPLRLIVSTLPGDTLEAIKQHNWDTLYVEHLTDCERRHMIVDYLQRFGKTLDAIRIDRIIAIPATANPLYLKILLDELRITGTHDKLDERLATYLAEPDIPSLLTMVLTRYQCHYERDRSGLVKEALGLIWSARRGLSETELLQLLRPVHLDQLPPAVWTPLRAAMEELLIDRGGILNFAHEFLRTAVKETCVPEPRDYNAFRLQLADYFEAIPASPRSCDELPWLLQQTQSVNRLRTCLLNIDCFLEMYKRDENELLNYWVRLGEHTVMGKAYLDSLQRWTERQGSNIADVADATQKIACFLKNAALYNEAELLMLKALTLDEDSFGTEHPAVAVCLNNIAQLLQDTNRLNEAEPLMCRALSMNENALGANHFTVATSLNNLAALFCETNRWLEAEPLYRRALSICEKTYGKEHPNTATSLSNYAVLLYNTNRMEEAEKLMRTALRIDENSLGREHPRLLPELNNLALILKDTNRMAEAERLMLRALDISEKAFGRDHPDVAQGLNSLAQLYQDTNRLTEAEPLMLRALSISVKTLGTDHPVIGDYLSNLAQLLVASNRLNEAEPLMRKALAIQEGIFGKEHSAVAACLNNLGGLFRMTNRFAEAEQFFCRALSIYEKSLGECHPNVAVSLNNLAELLQVTHRITEAEACMRKALSIHEEHLGGEHPSVAADLNRLAGIVQANKQFEEAESLYRRSLNIKETNLGDEHPDVATAMNNLAQLLQANRQFVEAESLFRGALRIYDNSLGNQHPYVAAGLNNLGSILQASNRMAEAESLFRKALTITEASLGEGHPHVATCLNNLGQLLWRTHRLAEAEPLYRRALTIREGSLGKGHPVVGKSLDNLARLLQASNRFDEAEPLMQRALVILIGVSRNTGHEHPGLPDAVSTYVGLLQRVGHSQGQIIARLRELGINVPRG